MRKQQGVSLVVSLLFLLIMTILGISAFNSSILQIRMSGAYQDRIRAFEAAEMGLRDAEDYVQTLSGLTGFNRACNNGLCYNGPESYQPTPVWKIPGVFEAKSLEYGRMTGAQPIPNIIAQPRYLIEAFNKMAPGISGYVTMYRITVRARGKMPGTQVTLQTVYKP